MTFNEISVLLEQCSAIGAFVLVKNEPPHVWRFEDPTNPRNYTVFFTQPPHDDVVNDYDWTWEAWIEGALRHYARGKGYVRESIWHKRSGRKSCVVKFTLEGDIGTDPYYDWYGEGATEVQAMLEGFVATFGEKK